MKAALGRADLGVELLNRAVARDPLVPLTHRNLAIVLAQANRPLEARAALNRAIELDERDYHTYFNGGSVLLAAGQLAESVAMFEKALELGPRDALTVGMLAYGYAALGKPERARALHAELERRAVDQFVSPVGRVFTAAAVGDRQAALQRLEEALSGSGSLPHLYR